MANPKPEQFAKAVLWHLAGLRADLASVKAKLEKIQSMVGKESTKETRSALAKMETEAVIDLYRKACDQAGIDPDPVPII